MKVNGPSFQDDEVGELDSTVLKLMARSRNWGIVCGFGYGCAFTLANLILLLILAVPHV